MYSNFLLGNLRITEGAQIKLKRIPYDLICRHAINEHGALTYRENSVARPATLGACQVRLQLSTLFVPSATRASFCVTYASSLVPRDEPKPSRPFDDEIWK